MATIVVTGAAGFLGRYLVARLVGQGLSVIPVSRRKLPGMYQVSDYRQSPSGDVMIHLAEEPDRGRVNLQADDYVKEAADVVEALSRTGQRIIYASSGVVYGDENEAACKVGAPVVAVDAYSRSKLLNEQIVLDAGGSVARLSNLFGRGMSGNNVISDIILQVPGEGPLKVRDDKPIRDYLHVSDAASALTLLMASGYRGIMNVGSGVGVSVRRLAELVLAAAGQEEREIVATASSPRRSINILDISETKETIGWIPVVRLEEQLAQLVRNKAGTTHE